MIREHIVLLGASGMAGTDIHMVLTRAGYHVSALNSSAIDITDKKKVSKVLNQLQNIGFIVNAAAFTGVDACETQEKKAMKINGKGVAHIANYCEERQIPLIQISTDYVFNGKSKRPYTEEDFPNPINVYGKSKLKAEKNIQKYLQDYYIIRTQWLYGQHGPNFIETLLKESQSHDPLSVVNDQVGSPTSTIELAKAILSIIKVRPKYGIYHFRSQGDCSWAEFADYFLKTADQKTVVKPVTSDKFPRPAKRPLYAILDISKYLSAGLYAPQSWQDSVEDYFKDR